MPTTLTSGLEVQGVPGDVAAQVGQLPPVGQPVRGVPRVQPDRGAARADRRAALAARGPGATLTGTQFFPHLISGPFHDGLVVVFVAATVMMLIAAAASFLTGREDKVRA